MAEMRERIKATAKDLYVRNGYAGFTFGDIAASLRTTRANIHYHFGSKQRLLDAIVEEFVVDAIERTHQHWTAPAPSLAHRIRAQLLDHRSFYRRFNRAKGQRRFWSPIARLRHDGEILGEISFRALKRVNRAFDECLTSAIREAIVRGELRADTPVAGVACQLRAIILSSAPMTLDSGRFDDIEQLFAAFSATLLAAYGQPKTKLASRPVRPLTPRRRPHAAAVSA
jgi:TetR/AcrR family transcriptional regulator, transcriptional repressor for nem operon